MIPTRQRYTLIASLYVSQAVPLGFLIVALPAILRERGVSLEQVGLLSALALPWLVKVLWAPWIDRYGSRRFGHYRSWIVPLQTSCVLAVLGLAFVEPGPNITGLVLAAAVFMVCSATQDVATDGLAVRSLRPDERGPANGIQVGGYYLGQVLGGGLILVLYHRLGWLGAVLALAAFLTWPLLPVLAFREPGFEPRSQRRRPDLGALRRFVVRPGAGTWITILLLYRAGEAMALTMVNPMLVDAGLSLEAIGLALGVAGSLAALAGAVTGGLWTRRLGRRRSLIVFGFLQALALAGYWAPASGATALSAVVAVTVLSTFTGGMATAALYTNMMDRSDPECAATDFTLQQSVCAVGPLVGSALSGFLAARLGYVAHFGICMLCALLAVALVASRLRASSAAPTLAEPVAEVG